ncbi:MAG: hypothetical protein AB7N76_22635 [Planctomycetota bacterium]
MLRRLLALFVVLAGLGLPSVALAKPVKGTVKMRDGRKFEDVEYEVRGKKVLVKRKYGDVEYDMALIEALIPAKAEAPEGETVGESDPSLDWGARFRLEAPDDWSVVKPDLPLVRGQLKHRSRDAIMMVRVRPAEKLWTFDRLEKNDVQKHFSDELSTFFRRIGGIKLGPATLHGAPVYRFDKAQAEVYGADKDQKRTIHELRFQRFGLEYALTISIGKDDAGALEHELEPAFNAFSFLPALDFDKERYSDHARGFSLTLPVEGWRMRVSPFNDDRPLVLENSDGRAVLEAEVASGRDPEELVRAKLAERKARSKRMAQEKVENDRLNGSEIIRFSFQDFREGETKLRGFIGFAGKAGEHLIWLQGQAPLSDSDSKKLLLELEGILSTVKLADPRRIATEARAAASAWELVAQGSDALAKNHYAEAIQHLDQAVEAIPGFALAHYLRGLARKGNNDFNGYKEDLERAGTLAPDAGYTKDLATAQRDEAAVAMRAGDFAKGLELWVKVFQADMKDEKVRKEVIEASKKVWDGIRKKKDWNAYRDIEKDLRRVEDDREVALQLLKIYYDAAKELGKERKFSNAKKALRSAKRTVRALRREKDYTKYERELDSAEKALDKEEERAKKR